ncbi:MAG: SWIM zinc finger family protein [Microcystaceae cyanobacterium]
MTNSQVESREWWVERWLELLDSYRFKKRLERGRNYAREGNVLSINFENSQVFAQVQGSETDPYQVSLFLDPFTDEDWDYVVETLSEKAIFSAQLLAGIMPNTIEKVFEQNGLSLFPFRLGEVRSRCTCPDKANPCKHIAAVYYQLADRFSEDPFVIFQLRGRTKENILEKLREKRYQLITQQTESNIKNKSDQPKKQKRKPSRQSSQKKNSLEEIRKFWQYDAPLDPSLAVILPPTEQQSLLTVIGKIPLPYEDANLVTQYLQQVYQTTQQRAMIAALNKDST